MEEHNPLLPSPPSEILQFVDLAIEIITEYLTCTESFCSLVSEIFIILSKMHFRPLYIPLTYRVPTDLVLDCKSTEECYVDLGTGEEKVAFV